MKNSSYCLPLSLFVLVGALTGCKKETNGEQTAPEKVSSEALGLEGTWKLKERQCFCLPGQVLNETVKFTGTSFTFFKDNVPTSSGTYSQADSAQFCGSTVKTPALRFVYSGGGGPALQNPSLSLTSTELILDYGVACDAPRETYVRVP